MKEKTMLKLINCTKKQPRFTDAELLRKYLKMAKKAIDEVCKDATDDCIPNRWALKQFAYCQARYLALSSIEYKDETHTLDDYQEMFRTVSVFKEILSLLTPKELIQTFPITKTFDGDKYQCKDYFFTMDSLKGLDMNIPFKEQGVDMLKVLCDYQNKWIDRIVIHSLLLVDKIRIANGEDDMFTAFCKSQGKEPPRYITVYKDANGKSYAIGENGKAMPLRKAKPRYLKVVK
jgi:hypothetical protein